LAGALHLLAGGTLDGRGLPPANLSAWKTAGPRPIRAIMLAAAVDVDWLQPSAPGGLALPEVERMLVSKDCLDRALRWYPRLEGRRGPEALGRVGPADTVGGKLEVVDLTCAVGRQHELINYQDSWPIWQRLGWYTFLCGDAAAATNSAKAPESGANNRAGR
jgi:hypothetical protein